MDDRETGTAALSTPWVRSCYVCYFGLLEPLVQTQVLPYLRLLTSGGAAFHLVTFEPQSPADWSEESESSWRTQLAAESIEWSWLRYHKRPSLPATLYDIAAGSRHVAALVRRHRIDIVHGRAHVGAAIGALVKKRTGARLIFDIRGFNPEEYVDAGNWSPSGLKYRLTKRAERSIIASADGFVILTERAKSILFPNKDELDVRGRPIEVIPCCVDADRFVAASAGPDQVRQQLGLEGRKVIVYIGALGGTYLSRELAKFFAVAIRRDSQTFAMILTQSDATLIKGLLFAAGVRDSDVMIKRVSPAEIPSYLSAADLAVSFIKPSYSKIASSPTKIPEYLMAGLPVISNSGVGDCDDVITTDNVGVLIDDLSESGYIEALDRADVLSADPALSDRCRESVQRRFDLTHVGGVKYRRLYERVMSMN